MKIQRTQKSQNNLENKVQSWKTQLPNFKTCYKVRPIKDSVVRALGQMQRSMKKNQESRNKSIYLLLINF